MSEQTLKTVIHLPISTSKRLLDECQKKFLLPAQVIAISLGEALSEPVVIQIPHHYSYVYPPSAFLNTSNTLRPIGEQKKLYLQILSQIITGTTSAKFEEVANTLHGTSRTYFGRSQEAVEGTGSSNEAASIRDTKWFASVNNSGDTKQKILTKLMRLLGFSPDYVSMISNVPYYRQLRFRGIIVKTD
jgi:SeqA protein C-terminal domain